MNFFKRRSILDIKCVLDQIRNMQLQLNILDRVYTDETSYF
jgi:hypothetical protein